MPDTSEQRAIILESERQFAHKLALEVIDRPSLTVWMILIPVIFVYYFFRLNRYKSGREAFIKHYMTGIHRVLEEAM